MNAPTHADLAALIADRIEAAGGWLRFDRYMALALYAPGLGYYAGGRGGADGGGPIGTPAAGGDFVTAPELSPLFAESVATQLLDWFDTVPARVVEFGAGNGRLAAGLLDACAQGGRLIEDYAIVEVSGELRARQQATIAELAPEHAARVRWLDQLPERIDGVALGNEVLDAMPVRLFVLDGGRVAERGVVLANEHGRHPGGLFAFADRPADPEFADGVSRAIADAGWSIADTAGYVGEWPEQAIAWTSTLAARIGHGALLTFDYGFPRAELYHRARYGGTLMCHARHRSHPDPLVDPGQRDITAHVDFTAVARAATDAGLELAGYTSQARFLLNCGLLERLARVPADDIARYAPRVASVQAMLSEAEMGELFKAIAFTRGIDTPPIGFVRGDRSVSLEPLPRAEPAEFPDPVRDPAQDTDGALTDAPR